MIRRAVEADIPRIVEMGSAFHAASHWSDVPFNPDHFARSAAELITRGAVFLAPDGMIGVARMPLFFNADACEAVEVFFTAKGSGRALLKAAEAWAAGEGLPLIAGLHEPGRVESGAALYLRRGYAPFNRTYRKVF